jgi:polysaccharide deacetylase 2 family uncharacterized protein YibQ
VAVKRIRGWRGLGWFWLVVAAVMALAAVTAKLLPEPDAAMGLAPAPASAADVAPVPPAAPPLGHVTAAPDPELLEAGPHGAVPRIAVNGRTSMRAYAHRPEAPPSQRPRIAMILGGVGLNPGIAEQAVQQLPPSVVLAINPYSQRLPALLAQARSRGFEMLVALPMESRGHPQNDVGDRALLTTLDPAVNRDRLLWVLGRFQGYVGALGALGPLRGERFAALSEPFWAMQDSLRARGLLYVDARPGVPHPERAWGRTIDIVIDEPADRGTIDLNLAALERMARERGVALGLGSDITPILIERITRWAAGLEGRGVMLAPITSMLQRPVAQP